MGRPPCCDKTVLKKGPWTPEEDQKLIDYIQKHGYGNWRTLPKNAGLQRCGKSCRLRWTNYLRPDIKRGRFSFEEEEIIIQLHSILGNKWSAIAARLPGRTDNEIKNYWNTHIRKRLLRMGIDPITHRPRLDLLDLSSILSSSLHSSTSQSLIMDLTRLLGLQHPILNPQILKLASSLMASNQGQNQENCILDVQENQLCNSRQFQNQDFQHMFQTNDQLHSQIQESNQSAEFPNVDQCNFGSQNCQLNEQWQNNLPQDYLSLPGCNYYGSSDQAPLMHQNDQNNQNFNLASVLSTPSSSPTPLNSTSNSATYINNGTEDEMESYCSNLIKFELPDILDVNEFM